MMKVRRHERYTIFGAAIRHMNLVPCVSSDEYCTVSIGRKSLSVRSAVYRPNVELFILNQYPYRNNGYLQAKRF